MTKKLGSVLPTPSDLKQIQTANAQKNGQSTQQTSMAGQSNTANTSLTASAITGEAFQVSVGQSLTGLQRGAVGAGGKLLKVQAKDQWRAKAMMEKTVPLLLQLQSGSWPSAMVNATPADTEYWARIKGLPISQGMDWGTDFREWPEAAMKKYVQTTKMQPVEVTKETAQHCQQWVNQTEPLLLGADIELLTVILQNTLQAYPPRKGDDYDKSVMYEMMIRGLDDLPLWALAVACNVHMKQSKWRPTVAELRDIAEREVAPIKTAVSKIKKAIEEIK